MKRGRLGRGFWLILALYAVLATVYSFALPLGEAPDEPGHYNYARIVAAAQRRPLGEEEHEAFQPPLYYWLAAPIAAQGDVTVLPLKGNADFDLVAGPGNLLVHDGDEQFPFAAWAGGWHLVRLLSVALGAVTVYGIYRFAYLAGRGSTTVALVAVALMVLTPQFTLLQGASSNDVLALCLGVLLLLEAAVLARGRATPRRLIATGIIWGLATLTKSSMLAGGAALGVALLLSHWRARGMRGVLPAVRDFAIAALPAALICGWWFVQNAIEYGDPLAWPLIFTINAPRNAAVDWLQQAWGLHRSYWLGYVALRLPEWLYVALLAPGLLAVAGLPLAARRRSRRWDGALVLLAAVQSVTFVVAWMRWTLAVQGTDQARLLYGALAAVVPLAAIGIVATVRSRWVAPVTVVVMLALNLYGLASGVLPVFAPAERVPIASVPAQGEAVTFGDSLQLLAWQAPERVAAGETLALDTWWQARRPVSEDVWLTLRVTAADGSVPVWKRGTPSAGRDTTDLWPAAVAVVGHHRIRLPADLPPGTYTLEAGLQEFAGGSWWPATAAGAAPRDVWPLGTLTVVAPSG
ncbi:MAG: glycosyltransferase family 39 protein [Anaerolineae bacterium]